MQKVHHPCFEIWKQMLNHHPTGDKQLFPYAWIYNTPPKMFSPIYNAMLVREWRLVAYSYIS